MTTTRVKSRYCIKCSAMFKYQCKCPNNRRMLNILDTYEKMRESKVTEAFADLGISARKQ